MSDADEITTGAARGGESQAETSVLLQLFRIDLMRIRAMLDQPDEGFLRYLLELAIHGSDSRVYEPGEGLIHRAEAPWASR